MSNGDQRMLHSDAFAWYMEKDPVLRSTIVAVDRLDREPDWDLLHSRIDRLTRLAPTLRMRVQAPPLRLGPPRWTYDESFDLDYHLRRVRLAEPAGWNEVLEFARTAAMDDFDRSRPLWEFTVLEGMSDGGAAFVTKLHHSLTDGIGGMQLAALVVDFGPEPPALDEAPPAPEGRQLSSLDLTVRSVADDTVEAAGAATRILRALPAGMLVAARHPVSTVRGAVATTTSIGRFVAPVNRPLSPVLGKRRTSRTLATLDVPFEQFHEAAVSAGGHINDAFIAALAGGMHRYHARRSASLDEVRVTVPISIRGDADAIGGNRITLTRIKMPAAIAEPGERIRHTREIMQVWRREPALGHTQEIAFGLNLLPRPYIGGLLKRVEMLASDVPGIPTPVWLAGARVIGYYAFGPTIGAGMNATLMSYADVCNIGVNIDTSAIDDPEALMACIQEAFDEILALAPKKRAKRVKAAEDTASHQKAADPPSGP
ncbi:MAG TPA: wax ester/triacylglycerol synthase domain-containing protein [Jatrophihabitans sp.]|nr:wax ester/triacylglycerol synthase domain-containing protein [Jatrophihabitans sp.]